MGAVLELTARQIAKEVVLRTSDDSRGDWKPLVVLFTTGKPADDLWQTGLEMLKKQPLGVLMAAGTSGADEQFLRKLTDDVVLLEYADQNSFKWFFKWITQSIKVEGNP